MLFRSIDVYSPTAFADDALCQPQSRAELRTLLNMGLTDAIRVYNADLPQYTYWDYQGGAWQKDNGLRIDHLLLSPQAADRLTGAGTRMATSRASRSRRLAIESGSAGMCA